MEYRWTHSGSEWHTRPRPRNTRSRSRAAACLALAILSGCTDAAQQDTALIHAAAPVFATEAARFAAGTISDNRWQWRITFTPDGNTAYFSVSDEFFPASRQATIVVSHRMPDGTWSRPETAPFSGTHSDIDPFITPDGKRLYFASIRPLNGIAKPDLDIFYVDRTTNGWSEPVRLGPEVNSDLDELYPSAASDGTLFFGVGPFAPTPDADWDIYQARRLGHGFAPRQPLADINTDVPFQPEDPTADWEFNPDISPDGQTLVFTSLRPGGFGRGDLYITHYDGARWSKPQNLGPAVNTANDEYHPTVSRDRTTLYFVRSAFEPGDFFHVQLNGR